MIGSLLYSTSYFSSLDKHNPKATILKSPEKTKYEDPEFVERVTAQSLKLLYGYMQEKYIKLVSCLESLPKEYHKLLLHEYFVKTIPIASLNKEAEAMLWYQRLICYGSLSLKSALLYVDSVLNLLALP